MTRIKNSYLMAVFAILAILVLSGAAYCQQAYADELVEAASKAPEAEQGNLNSDDVEEAEDGASESEASDEADFDKESLFVEELSTLPGDSENEELRADDADDAALKAQEAAIDVNSKADVGDAMQTQATAASVSYSTHVQNVGWQSAVANGVQAGTTGKSLRLEGLKITLSGIAGSVVYQTHVQNVGWQTSVADGRLAGTTGQSLRLEGLKIWLTGEAANRYDILYRTHVQNIGWQPWVSNGALAGTTGRSLRLEALEVKLSEKAATASSGNPGVTYQTHVQNIGWQPTQGNGATAGTTGQSLRVEALKVNLNSGPYSGGIKYQAHVQNVGWQNWVTNGAQIGTTGQALRVEALRIALTGDIANYYDVRYRTHVENVGWEPWVINGMGSGSVGQAQRVEAIEIILVNKATKTGWEGSGTNWAYVEKGVKTSGRWVVTSESPIEEFQYGLQRYWIDGNGALAVSRYVDPTTSRDAKAGYAAYAMDKGYVLRGKRTMAGGSVLLADNDGRIPTTTGWITSSAYDGTSQKYYVEKSGVAALAKTGLFTVGGVQYYGLPNDGYIMRGGYWHLNGAWYASDGEGRLTLDSSGSVVKYIERYVSWAIATANDNAHGYSQANRWGPDYDCSSFVVSSLKNSGFAVGQASWTGNMISELTKCGFRWYSNLALRTRGDIMLVHNDSHQHTEIFLGNNQIVGATSSENGGIYGAAGDQTGREIRVGTYYNAPWEGFLRYVG